jgi:dGTPase
MYRILFSKYLVDVESDRRDSKVFTEFINSPWVNQDYSRSTAPAALVRDFIAGMTDRYFLKRFEECVLPHRVEGSFR